MKLLKRLLIFVVVLVVFVIGAALVAPILFKDQIVANVKQGINASVNAEVDFQDINVSFLRSFPAINLTIDDYSVVGIDTFAGYPLATGKQASLDLNFWSVISGSETGNYVIESVELIDPDVRILVLNETLANYNITKTDEVPTDEAETTGQMLFSLEAYSVENGHFIYDDRVLETFIEAKGLNHSGEGDFTLDVFDLDTESDWQAFTLEQYGITYFNEVKGSLDAVMNIDLANSVYTFLENEMLINALALNFDGSIAMPAEDIDFDLTFNAPSADFRQLWSLIPAAYTIDYQNVKTSGQFSLNGSVKGPYNGDVPTYPAFQIKMDVDNGSVQYPGSPVAVNGINAAVDINSPSSNLNDMIIALPRFAMNLGGDPFQGNFTLTNPIKDPTVDARIDGKIDLTKWADMMPLEGVDELSGMIDADLTLQKVSQSTLEAGNYGAVVMDGKLSVTNVVYAATGMPKIIIDKAAANFSPQKVDIPNFTAQLGKSDLSGSARIDNLLAYFSSEKTMTGAVNLKSTLFDLDEWMVTSSSEEVAVKSPAEKTLASSVPAATSSDPLFNRFAFDIKADFEEIRYGEYRLTNNKLDADFQANQTVVKSVTTTIGETYLTGNGRVINAWDYYFGDAILGGTLNMYSPNIDADDFMSEEVAAEAAATEGTEASTAVVPIPNDVDLIVTITADRVKYTDMLLEDVSGDLLLRDKQALVQNGKMKLLGGSMAFGGSYDTSTPGDPEFSLNYDLSSLSFPKAFQYLNTFQQLAPIAKFLDGNFNSELLVSGKLGQDLYPVLSSINAEGFIQTLNASLASIEPLQKVGNALNVNELKSKIDLKGIKSWFKVVDGTVEVEPFNTQLAGIPMQIKGKHGLNAEMEYSILASVPRSLIEGNIVTGSAIGALDKLAGEASRLGLNIQAGDTLNFSIGLTGSLGNTKTSVKLLGTNGTGGGTGAGLAENLKDQVEGRVDEAKDEAQARLDEERTKLEAQRDSAHAALIARRQAAADSIARMVQQRKDALSGQVNDAAQDAAAKAKEALDKQLEGKTQEEIDRLKEEARRLNPFGKKKKDGGK